MPCIFLSHNVSMLMSFTLPTSRNIFPHSLYFYNLTNLFKTMIKLTSCNNIPNLFWFTKPLKNLTISIWQFSLLEKKQVHIYRASLWRFHSSCESQSVPCCGLRLPPPWQSDSFSMPAVAPLWINKVPSLSTFTFTFMCFSSHPKFKDLEDTQALTYISVCSLSNQYALSIRIPQ